jgi:NodT family efflux transporter outer membrane factor (OMF) lipoprotein
MNDPIPSVAGARVASGVARRRPAARCAASGHKARGYIFVLLICLAGCAVGPDYVRPSAPIPEAFKELQGWAIAQPSDDTLRGSWWEVFGDPQLSALAEQIDGGNFDLAAAEARFRQAEALIGSARSRYFPTVTIGVTAARARQSGNLTSDRPSSGGAFSNYSLPLEIAWEADLWGRTRRSVESSTATAEATRADLASARLSLQTDLATDYFQLRALDAERDIVNATVAAYDTSLTLTQNRYRAGVAARADVAQAVTQLESTKALAVDLSVQRAQLEHAIAVLVGIPPAMLTIAPTPLTGTPPVVPVTVPSQLLERRPDIAAAARRVASANAEIGVARAAYYPAVTLSTSGGFESAHVSDWFTWPSRFWSVGPGISETVYDGGLRKAQNENARAVYDETVATYRNSVLTAFQEVEDNLAALRLLEQEAQVQDLAVKAGRESVTLTTNQYKGGTVSYLAVVVSQTLALSNERTAVDILNRRMLASVRLIKALGGGWNEDEMVRE